MQETLDINGFPKHTKMDFQKKKVKMNDIVDNLAEVFLCMLIMYNIKLFYDIKRHRNMEPACKYFYVGWYIGVIAAKVLFLDGELEKSNDIQD